MAAKRIWNDAAVYRLSPAFSGGGKGLPASQHAVHEVEHSGGALTPKRCFFHRIYFLARLRLGSGSGW